MDTQFVNSEATSMSGGASSDQDRTIVNTASCTDDTSITERVATPNREEQTVVSSEIRVNVSQDDAAVAGEKSSGVGRVVAGAIGGVLLGSAALYYKAHAADNTPHPGSATLPADDDVADVVAEEVKSNSADLSDAQLGDDEVKNANVDVDVNVLTEGHADELVDNVDELSDNDALESSGEADAFVDDTANDESTNDTMGATVNFAEGVNDEMSFSQAFAAARADVGAGGAFEWRGQIYGTYYADEWESMSDDEKDAFGSKFDFGGADSNYEAEATNDDDVFAVEDNEADVVADDDEIEIIVDDELDDDYGDEVEFLGVVNDDGVLDISFGMEDESVVFIDIVPDDEIVDFEDNSFDAGNDLMASADDYDNDVDVDVDGDFFA